MSRSASPGEGHRAACGQRDDSLGRVGGRSHRTRGRVRNESGPQLRGRGGGTLPRMRRQSAVAHRSLVYCAASRAGAAMQSGVHAPIVPLSARGPGEGGPTPVAEPPPSVTTVHTLWRSGVAGRGGAPRGSEQWPVQLWPARGRKRTPLRKSKSPEDGSSGYARSLGFVRGKPRVCLVGTVEGKSIHIFD